MNQCNGMQMAHFFHEFVSVILRFKFHENKSRDYDRITQYTTNCTHHFPTQDTSIHGAGTRSFCIDNIDIIHFCSGDSCKSEHFTSYG
jgi:hypothetical protein